MSNCDFVTLPCGILGQVLYLIVLIFAVYLTFLIDKNVQIKNSNKLQK